jgi:hypothetical protein
MSTRLPIEAVTDPITLWLFRHGFEDPDWGKSKMGQLTIAITLHDLASKLTDRETGKQIQGLLAKVIVNTAETIVK